MPCYYPMTGWRSRSVEESGKRRVVFDPLKGFKDRPVVVACGQCVGCRLERARQWAVRCHHEASLHDDNCFVTLTYDDEHLPKDWSLDKKAFPKFAKRLRKKIDAKIKYYMCGEYGPSNGRPHYHALLFGWRPADLKLWTIRNGQRLYTSEFIEELWPFGFSSVGEVTFESAGYVARYVVDKLGKEHDECYTKIDRSTGEIQVREPEYNAMSRGGRTGRGVSYEWFQKFKKDVFPSDEVIVRGHRMPPPRYYDSLFEIDSDLDAVKKLRQRRAARYKENNAPERLATREEVKKRQMEFLRRTV